ncbi:MAG: hypothetical protein IT366_17945 [Candidatus Hydrogenedentes bacterium]|nr:hypothetical protein [Candidatus Hydrogenedentota bacterium]
MRNVRTHLQLLTRRPATAQTVQELKYDTLLVYIQNAYTLAFGGIVGAANISNIFFELGGSIPYKNFFGGGGSSSGGGGNES